MVTDDEHNTINPQAPWQEYYARRVIECLGQADKPRADHLALYHFDGCPFCMLVRRAIDELGLEVELRDIHAERNYLEQLREGRGRTTVPVLRITSPDGEERWMPESTDIVLYLQASYGHAAA